MADDRKANEPSREETYAPGERTLLLALARRALVERASGRVFAPELNGIPESLRKPQACFVTLFNGGLLRGCVGQVKPELPLYQGVVRNACAAGFSDLRFKPVTLAELPQLDIEISLLSIPVRLCGTPLEILDRLRPHLDGVLIECQGKPVTFLPQVWEQLSDKEQFLQRLCTKADWDKHRWRSPEALISVYQVISFKSQDFADQAP